MRAIGLALLCLGCGGQVQPLADAAPVDSGSDADDTAVLDDVSTFDDGRDPSPYLDAGDCLSRPAASCTCDPGPCDDFWKTPLRPVIDMCLKSSVWACGEAYVDFNADGCAIAIRTDRDWSSFWQCFASALATSRWPCESKKSQRAYILSCTLT